MINRRAPRKSHPLAQGLLRWGGLWFLLVLASGVAAPSPELSQGQLISLNIGLAIGLAVALVTAASALLQALFWWDSITARWRW